ncbi:MAG TPA: elements of external origin [Oxalobacteraceae bacterium]|jgi:hypothetical protein|nr:elements of external origin [Oxalobacteraceae bacterium]
MEMSIRAYARHRGLKSENSVRKALKDGRIKLLPNGKIDSASADKAWTAQTDKSRQRSTPAAAAVPAPGEVDDLAPRAIPTAAIDSVRATLRASGAEPSGEGITFTEARTANEILKAQDRALRIEKMRGELVNRANAESAVFSLARRERDSWVQWPPRVAALLAAQLGADPHLVETQLEQYVRRHLEELAEVDIELR